MHKNRVTVCPAVALDCEPSQFAPTVALTLYQKELKASHELLQVVAVTPLAATVYGPAEDVVDWYTV